MAFLKKLIKNGICLLIINDKKLAWFKITQEFNCVSPNNCLRDTDSLRKYYDNLKEDIRKKAGHQRRSLYKTGGGPPSPIKKDDCYDLILDIVNTKTIFGLANPCDNDEVTEKQISMEDSEPWTETIMESDTNSVSETFNGTGIPTDQIEVVFVDQPNSSCASMNLSDKSFGTKPGDLRKVLNPCLQKNIKHARKRPNFSRRRPSVIRPLSSSTLAEKYEILLDKKIHLANGLQQEHELIMTLLRFDIALKKKQLIATGFHDTDVNLIESAELML
ncbi:hypothetical protein RN001_014646 [Aquatica leii]|uniref:Regulatory protein zeste n=1 Tax=Aquatica leii TaxID=1421715 RepID=A0AAN7PPL6_9COLE|nr:hypothetical protein RN001_014646 [Aquatica leii]